MSVKEAGAKASETIAAIERPSALLFPDGVPLPRSRFYTNSSVFVIASGPGLLALDLDLLRKPGILTMGLNNSPKTFRPNLWVSVDPPQKFLRSVWMDPTIQKFIPYGNLDLPLFDSRHWMATSETPATCPNLFVFEASVGFSADDFLTDSRVCLGNPLEEGGGRSVLLSALKVLYSLGVSRIFLLGVDFRMDSGTPYHFEESVSRRHIEANNRAYPKIARYLDELAPRFAAAGVEIWNCQPGSALTAFPHLPLDQAVNLALRDFPRDLEKERTRGLYGRNGENNTSIDDEEKTTPDPSSVLRRPSREKRTTPIDAPSILEPKIPEDSGIVIFSTQESEWLIPWFLRNLRRHHSDLPVVLFETDLSTEVLATVEAFKVQIRTYDPSHQFPHPWFHKPFVLQQSPFTRTVFLDLDCEIRTPIPELFQWCDKGIVLGRDLHPMRQYRKLFRNDFFFNSGVIGAQRGNPVIDLWCDATRKLFADLRGDQEILNLTLVEHEIPVIVTPDHYHQMRLDGEHPAAKIMHWTGPSGKEIIKAKISA